MKKLLLLSLSLLAIGNSFAMEIMRVPPLLKLDARSYIISEGNRELDEELFVAIKNGIRNPQYYRKLLQAGANRNARLGYLHRGYTLTPLHFSAQYSNPEAAAELITQDNINIATECGFTALHSAVSTGCTNVACLLLKNGANPNAQNNKGRTPLHYAIGPQTKLLLLSYDADPTIGDALGELRKLRPDLLFTLYLMEQAATPEKTFEDCPICMEHKRLVAWPNCKHMLCIKCIVNWHQAGNNSNKTECPFCRNDSCPNDKKLLK